MVVSSLKEFFRFLWWDFFLFMVEGVVILSLAFVRLP